MGVHGNQGRNPRRLFRPWLNVTYPDRQVTMVPMNRVTTFAAVTVSLGLLAAAAIIATGPRPEAITPATHTLVAEAPAVDRLAPPTPGPEPAPEIRPGEIVATIAGDALPVFDAPGGTQTETLGKWSPYDSILTVLGVGKETVDSSEWIEIMLPFRAGQQTGWIRASDVTVASTDLVINVYLDEKQLEVVDGETVVLSTSVAIGKPETPTPLGLYSITDPVDLTYSPGGVYGPYALGISGYQGALESYNGGDPQLALHGTNRPSSIGQATSNGCVRLPNDVIVQVATLAPLGTPVVISQNRQTPYSSATPG